MAVPTSNISMTTLNTVFGKGFSLSKYYGTTFTSGSAPASGPISYSMFAGKSAVFTPTSLSAPLITWFKGDSGLTTSSWTNNGTNGGSATFAGTGLSIVTVNGKNAIRLINTNYPGAPSCYGSYLQSFSTQARAFFIVMRLNVQPTQSPIVLIAQTNTGYNLNMYGSPGAPYEMLLNNNNGATNKIISTLDDTISALSVKVCGVVNSATSTANNQVYVNGTAHTIQSSYNNVASGYTTGTNTSLYTWIGSDNIGAGMTTQDCTICEILCYSGEVSAADASNVNTYLINRWGVVSITASVEPTIASGRTFYTFTTNGSFTIAAGGSKTVEIMAIGGGGGGGCQSGGGGGAGNMIVATGTLTAGTYTVVIGGGGAGGTVSSSTGQQGSSSTFGLILTALGGGGGGTYSIGGGQNGGCGGGGSELGQLAGGSGVQGSVSGPLTATQNLATNGGTGINDGSQGGAGGGGTSAAGTNHSAGQSAGNPGGAGTLYYGTYYGGGGGGSQGGIFYGAPYNGGAGGTGGGGTGSTIGASGTALVRGTAGAANTGGGGGGATAYTGDTTGLPGGTGIVIVSYAN